MSEGKIIRVNFFSGSNHANVAGHNLDSREYDYFKLRPEDKVKAGDYAVVNVQGVLKIVRIHSVLQRSSKATRYAITTFSLEEYEAAVERKNAITNLQEEILERAKKASERKKLEDLAGSDPVLASMLEDLKKLESE